MSSMVEGQDKQTGFIKVWGELQVAALHTSSNEGGDLKATEVVHLEGVSHNALWEHRFPGPICLCDGFP